MKNADKSYLRWIMKNKPERTDADIVGELDCSLATVKKYRRAFQHKGTDNANN